MTELTKELFEQTLDRKLKDQTKDLKSYSDEQTEALARIVSTAFEKEREYLDKRFAEVLKMLDVRKLVEEHERKIARLEHALNVKL